MNNHLIRELERFLERAHRDEITSFVIATTTNNGDVRMGYEIRDFALLGALDVVRYEAARDASAKYVLDCQNEKDTEDWDCKTQVETIEDSVVRKTRPKTS
jgi:hypothetical protein